jgi:hypothetical protein
MRGDVKLRYCIVDGEIRDVAVFAFLQPKQRPTSFCPECNNLVTLKLGTSGKKAYHAAHRSENLTCSLSHPESALHFNTKVYIYDQLKTGTKLFIKQICGGWTLLDRKPHCFRQKYRPYLWLENWDDVQMERNVDKRRPDIVLYRAGKPVAAIEICVSHAMDNDKKNELQKYGLPWIEIKADGNIVDEYFVKWTEEDDDEFPWTIEKPLIFDSCYPQPNEWICEYCKKAPEEYAERLAIQEAKERTERLKRISDEREKERKKESYWNKDDNQVIFAKRILLLKPLAEYELIDIFVIRRDSSEPPYKPEELYLKEGRVGGKILISEEPITDNSKEIIKDFYRDWLKVRSIGVSEVVHVTKWVNKSEFDRLITNYVMSYRWHSILRKWIK